MQAGDGLWRRIGFMDLSELSKPVMPHRQAAKKIQRLQWSVRKSGGARR